MATKWAVNSLKLAIIINFKISPAIILNGSARPENLNPDRLFVLNAVKMEILASEMLTVLKS